MGEKKGIFSTGRRIVNIGIVVAIIMLMGSLIIFIPKDTITVNSSYDKGIPEECNLVITYDSNPYNLTQKKVYFDETHSPKYYTDHDYLGYNLGYEDFVADVKAAGHFIGVFEKNESVTYPYIYYTLEDLLEIDVLIIIEPFEYYTTEQIDIIEDWYNNYGGSLLLIRDHYYDRPINDIAIRFGFSFSNHYVVEYDDYNYGDQEYVIYTGSNIVSHEITLGVNRVEMKGGPGITSYPTEAQKLIVTDNDGTSYFDDWPYNDGNEVPTIGAPVMCALENSTNEEGRLIVLGDPDFWSSGELGSGPIRPYLAVEGHSILARNSIKWLLNYNEDYLLDHDGDTISDYLEAFTYFSNPNSNDTDEDGLFDWEEVQLKTSLTNTDTDSDGVSDYLEVMVYNSNPLQKDSDTDGLNDYDEIYVYFTDPTNFDTDFDKIPDGYEINNNLDPLNSTDAELDYDNDLLTNYAEYIYSTDPYDNDTDDDQLSDYDEKYVYYSNPGNNDTDNDGLLDGDEALIFGTDLRLADTDNDGYTDYEEVVILHSDPLDPNDPDPQPTTPPSNVTLSIGLPIFYIILLLAGSASLHVLFYKERFKK
ncbi:MAG: hypothetical protein FK734_11555 [Asgard group archaeon]|nr:hypothetical protein [Asgard group archaeon]